MPRVIRMTSAWWARCSPCRPFGPLPRIFSPRSFENQASFPSPQPSANGHCLRARQPRTAGPGLERGEPGFCSAPPAARGGSDVTRDARAPWRERGLYPRSPSHLTPGRWGSRLYSPLSPGDLEPGTFHLAAAQL